MGGISVWQLLIVALIIVLLFGTKKLQGLGGDFGSAVKGFKKAMSDDDKDQQDADIKQDSLFEKRKDDTFEPKFQDKIIDNDRV